MRIIAIGIAALALIANASAQVTNTRPRAEPTVRQPQAPLKLPPATAGAISLTTAPLTFTGMKDALPPPATLVLTTPTLTFTGLQGALPPQQTKTITTASLTFTGLLGALPDQKTISVTTAPLTFTGLKSTP